MHPQRPMMKFGSAQYDRGEQGLRGLHQQGLCHAQRDPSHLGIGDVLL